MSHGSGVNVSRAVPRRGGAAAATMVERLETSYAEDRPAPDPQSFLTVVTPVAVVGGQRPSQQAAT
jgi:hypothetical protein